VSDYYTTLTTFDSVPHVKIYILSNMSYKQKDHVNILALHSAKLAEGFMRPATSLSVFSCGGIPIHVRASSPAAPK
jgi:hypothetical protein